MMRYATTLFTGLLLVLTGCAGSAQTGGQEYEQIDAAQVNAEAYQSALDMISELRPGWLDLNEEPAVYVDGEQRSRGVKELEGLQSDNVQQIRFYDPGDQMPGYVEDSNRPTIVVQTNGGS